MPQDTIEADEHAIHSSRAVTLPIHPLVTLEQWVAAAHFSLIDGGLSSDEEIALLESIHRDPAAVVLYGQVCRDEELMVDLFACLADPASPACVG